MRRSNSSSSSGLEFDLHPLAGRRFVDKVDRLVRQEAVGDVSVGERAAAMIAGSVMRTP